MFAKQQAFALFAKYKAAQRAADADAPSAAARRALDQQITAAASVRQPDETQLLALLQRQVECHDGAASNMVSVPDHVYARGAACMVRTASTRGY